MSGEQRIQSKSARKGAFDILRHSKSLSIFFVLAHRVLPPYTSHMSWEFRRKFIYAFAVIVTIAGVTVFFLRGVIFPEPSCVDGKQNGYEVGIDCGGVCALRCSQDVVPLTVLWSKALRSGEGKYDLVAMINNSNIDNASQVVAYTFTMYDDKGVVTGDELSGTTTLPLDGKIPVILQNIPLSKKPSNVIVTLRDGPHYTVTESPSSPTIKIANRRFENGQKPRAYAVVVNTKQQEIFNLPVRLVLFDENDNAFAVGQSIVPFLEKEGIKEVIFTWNEPLPVVPTRIGVYPIFNPFDAIGY